MKGKGRLTIRMEEAGPCRRTMHVEAPADAVRPAYEDIVKTFTGAARVPGFRPGKAPAQVVERRYARQIAEEARSRLLPDLYREALAQEGVRPESIVGVSDVEFKEDGGLSFEVTLDVAPAFKLPRYKRIAVKRQPVEVTDEQVAETYRRMLDDFATFRDVTDRPVQDGDLVLVDYRGVCGGRPVGELAPDCSGLGEGKDFWVLMAPPEFLPGFHAGLNGAKIGEKREIPVRFPDGYHVPAAAGKEAVYDVEVKGLREKVPARVDEELLKRFQVDSEEALRDKVRQDLEEAAEADEKSRLKSELGKHLLEKTDFDLPASVLEHETRATARDIIQQSALRGATREHIESRQEEILSAAARSSKDRVKLSYILAAIADAEKIEVEESEVDRRLEILARRYRTTAANLRSELEKRQGLEEIRREVRGGKTLDFLLEHAKIKK